MLFLSFSIHYTINALFFTDETMHQILIDEGSYNISYQFPKIIISCIVSIILLRIMLKCINIKFIIFFIVNFILLILFWFYLTCFNGIYENTQIYLFENTFISFAISLLFPFLWNIIPTLLRMCALGNKESNGQCIYSISKFCQLV